jgi:hypothetical protein
LVWLTEGKGGHLTLVRRRTSGTRQEVSNKSAIRWEQAIRASSATVRKMVGVLALFEYTTRARRFEIYTGSIVRSRIVASPFPN